MISKRVEGTIAGWLTKREDLFEEERQAFMEYVRDMSNVEALATGRWFSNGVVRVPEDQPKVSQAIKVAKIAKVDPLQYKSPMELIDKHASIKLKGEPIDPHTVSTLHKVRELPKYGIEIFDVEDGEESRQNMREIINTHFGVNSNPWCLLQGDGEGNLTEKSKDYWEHYNGYPKQVAFVNGKLNSFSANDDEYVIWWDRNDVSRDGISIVVKVPNDELNRSCTAIIDVYYGEVIEMSNMFRGNQQNGVYEEWHENGQLSLQCCYVNGKREGIHQKWYANGQLWERYNYKFGQVEGLCEDWYENGQLLARSNYKDGKREGLYEEWYEDGQLLARSNYKDGKREGLSEEWYENGQLRRRGNYKDGKLDGLFEAWYENGQLLARCNYKDGKLDDLYEEWYEDGQLMNRSNYKDGSLDGLYEEFAPNGQLVTRSNYKDDQPDGLFELWYKNGQLKERFRYKDGKRDGLYEEWFENGQMRERRNYKDDQRDGLCEYWYANGLEVGIYYFQCGMPIATGDKALAMAQKEKESVKQLSQKSQSTKDIKRIK